jgi:hypothetical protein
MRNPKMKRHQVPSTTHKTFTPTALAALIVFFAVGVTARSQDQTDWRQWTTKDVHKILSGSPWIANCCRTWLGGGESIPPDPGFTVVIVSSRAVREALVRNMELDKRYEKLDTARHEEVDRRADACLNEKFDDSIVFSFSFLGTGQDAATRKTDKLVVSNMYLVASDGRKVAGNLTPESVSMTCGAFPQPPALASLWPLWNNLPPSWWPLGRGKEVAFPRFVDGKPTIGPDEKTIRIYLKNNSGSETHRSNNAYVHFSIDKLVYQGKPDF